MAKPLLLQTLPWFQQQPQPPVVTFAQQQVLLAQASDIAVADGDAHRLAVERDDDLAGRLFEHDHDRVVGVATDQLRHGGIVVAPPYGDDWAGWCFGGHSLPRVSRRYSVPVVTVSGRARGEKWD